MTGLEAIPQLTELLSKLIKGAKDRETQPLVQEIQSHQFIVQTALMEANAKMLKMETEHFHAIAAIREGHRLEALQLNSKIEQLKAQLDTKNASNKADELDDDCKKMLVAIANTDGITRTALIQWMGLEKVKGEHMFDQLNNRKFITAGLIGGSDGFPYHVTSSGRDYMARANLLGAKPERPLPQRPSRSAGFGRQGMF